jgi:hypothetical protein
MAVLFKLAKSTLIGLLLISYFSIGILVNYMPANFTDLTGINFNSLLNIFCIWFLMVTNIESMAMSILPTFIEGIASVILNVSCLTTMIQCIHITLSCMVLSPVSMEYLDICRNILLPMGFLTMGYVAIFTASLCYLILYTVELFAILPLFIEKYKRETITTTTD